MKIDCLLFPVALAVLCGASVQCTTSSRKSLPPVVAAEWNLEAIPDSMVADGAFAYKDKLYNGMFTRSLGWNGGDGVYTVGLPGYNVLWTFNDSFYGVVDSLTRARGACSFPRNSLMVQTASDCRPGETSDDMLWLSDYIQTDDPSAPGYYQILTHIDHPKAQQFEDGIAKDWLYWSGEGNVVGDKLHLIWLGIHTPGTGEMIRDNAALAIYSLDGEPGDTDYMRLESVDHEWIPYNPYGYGQTLLASSDGHLYLYTYLDTGEYLLSVPLVARTKGYDLTTGLEYYVPCESGELEWQDSYPTFEQAKHAGIAPGEGTFALPWVLEKDGGYYMFAQQFPYGHELNILRADTPWGPFTDCRRLLSFPNPLDPMQHDMYGDQYRFLYMLNLHQSLSRDGELVISTNTDVDNSKEGADDSFWRNFDNPGSADWYRPFFYRVYNWDKVF